MNSLASPLSASSNTDNDKATTPPSPSIKDLLEDGIYLLFLLRGKNAPSSCAEFNQRIDQYLSTFDRVCKTFNKSADAVMDAKYAFCALLDEIILSSRLSIRDDWEQSPLQLRLFGEHLAGETFFNKLEQLRQDAARNIEQLEVFHACLILGFQGKYLLEGTEKLNYLIAKLGQEIAAVRGPSKGFSPNWQIPFKFNEYVRHELPLWLYYALLAVGAIALFLVLQWLLSVQLKAMPVAGAISAHVESAQAISQTSELPTSGQNRLPIDR